MNNRYNGLYKQSFQTDTHYAAFIFIDPQMIFSLSFINPWDKTFSKPSSRTDIEVPSFCAIKF